MFLYDTGAQHRLGVSFGEGGKRITPRTENHTNHVETELKLSPQTTAKVSGANGDHKADLTK